MHQTKEAEVIKSCFANLLKSWMSETEAAQAKHLEHLQEIKVSKQRDVCNQVG